MVIDSFAGRLSSHPSTRTECATPADITRLTPYERWDMDSLLPGVVSQRPGSRFGR